MKNISIMAASLVLGLSIGGLSSYSFLSHKSDANKAVDKEHSINSFIEAVQYESGGRYFGMVKTRYGDLKVVENESYEKDIEFNGVSIFKKTDTHMKDCNHNLEGLYHLGDNDVVVASLNCLSDKDFGENYFIKIEKSKNISISDSFPASSLLSKSEQLDNSYILSVGDKIIVDGINRNHDLDSQLGSKKDSIIRKVIYENGKVSIIESNITRHDKEKSCEQVYEVYKRHVETGCSDEKVCSDVKGIQNCEPNYLDVGFSQKLEQAAQLSCQESSIMNYDGYQAGFKYQVCGL